jgi:outer membrane autotransporter protein
MNPQGLPNRKIGKTQKRIALAALCGICVLASLRPALAQSGSPPPESGGSPPSSPSGSAIGGGRTTRQAIETPTTPGAPAAWFSAGWTHLKNSSPGASYKGDSYSGSVGADFQPSDRMILGLALSGEGTKLDISSTAGHLTTTGYGVNPYAVVTLTDNFYVDVLAGASWLNNDMDRASGAVTADYDSFRWLVSANLNGRFTDGPWQFLPTVGYLYVHQKDDAYTERGTGGGVVPSQIAILGQSRLGGRIGYVIDKWTPYVGARWEHNFVQPSGSGAESLASGGGSTSRDGAFVQAGVEAVLRGGFSGGLEVNSIQRSDLQTYGVLGNIRYAF